MNKQKKKALLVEPSDRDFYKEAKVKEVVPNSASLTLATLAASILKAGHDVQVIDLGNFINPAKALEDKLKEYKPDFIGVTASTPLFSKAAEVVEIAKAVDGKIIAIAGGPHVSGLPKESLERSKFDILVIGEGDITIKEVLNDVELSLIKGIAYRIGNEIIINKRRPLLDNLDKLPLPAWHLFPVEKCVVPKFVARNSPVGWLESCYDDQTEVLTEDGWKFFKDLAPTDKIATLNPKTKTLEYQKPLSFINEQYSGEMYSINSPQIDLLVTPNHKLYVRRKRKNVDFELEEVRSLFGKTCLYFKRDANWQGVEKKYFILPGERYNLINGKKVILKKEIIMDLWLEFLGYYLSEGNCQLKKDHRKPNANVFYYRIKISQSSYKNRENFGKIEKCLKKMGIQYYKVKSRDYGKNEYEGFEFLSKPLYEYLKQFGKCNEKYIPKEIKQLSARQLKILVNALVLGDGHTYRKGRYGYKSTSKILIDDLQEIALKIGYTSNYHIQKNNTSTIRGRIIKSYYPCYGMYLVNTRKTPKLPNYSKKDGKNGYNQIKKTTYRGNIYCCEVPNHIIYVRRNGKTVWCGNSRGCPYGCVYCTKSIFQRSFRVKSVERVIAEIEHMKKSGFKEFHIADDCFTMDMERAEKICDEIIRRNIDMPWVALTGVRVDRVNENLLRKMKNAGCYRLFFGLESGNQEILNRIKKNINLEQVREAVKMANKVGIEAWGSFMIGLPGETEETMKETIKFAKSLPLDMAKLTITIPLPATDLYNEYLMNKQIITNDWSKFNMYTPARELYKHENLDWDTIEKYYKKFYREFYFRPGYILHRLKSDLKNGMLIEHLKIAMKTTW